MNDSGRSTETVDPEALRVGRSLSRSFALHAAARALEALSVGWLACALVVATVALTTRDTGAEGWIVGVVCGACAAACVWLEHPPRRDDHVRTVDRRLALDGALVTTAGVVTAARAGSLAAALVRRVAARLSGNDLARAALPRTPLALLASLAGAAVLFAAQDARSSDPLAPEGASARASQALAGAAQALRAAAREAPPGVTADAASLAALADDFERAAQAPSVRGSRLADLERRVSAAVAVDASPSTARSLELARSALEAVRRADPAGARNADPGAGWAGTRGASPTAGGAAGASGSTASAEPGSAGALAPGSADGRMSAPNADPRAHAVSSATGPAAGALTVERGVGATRWWSPAYDAVVERWLAGARDAPDHAPSAH